MNNPVSVICAQTGAEPPTTVANTATVSTTGGANIIFRDGITCYGVNFTAGAGAVNAQIHFDTWSARSALIFSDCLFEINATGGSANFSVGATNTPSAGLVLFKNTRFKSSGNSASGILLGAQNRIIWDGGSVVAPWAHANLFGIGGLRSSGALVRGVDLSVLGSGKNLLDTASALVADIGFANCRLGVGAALVNGVTPDPGGVNVWMHNCDSAATNYRYQRVEYAGRAFSETIIVKSGGSTDGTTPYSIRMLSSANSNYHNALNHDVSAVWNDVTTAITVTVDIVHDSTTALTDAEVWLEVDYPISATAPLAGKASGAVGVLGTAASQTASTATWTTTGLTNPNRQRMQVTFTPAMKGYLLPRVRLARPSYTIYVDNMAVVT